jgi:1-acyl-sn-glycerol-3-phosphate acyltransferase
VHPVPLWFLEATRPLVWTAARALFRIRFGGIEHVPAAGPVLLTPNHVSYLDPVLVTIPVRRVLHYMAHDPLFRVPALGPIMRWCRAFPVREGETDGAAVRAALRVLHRGEGLVIFPEGGRSVDGRLQAFRPGAFRFALTAKVPVVPVTIVGAYEAWPHHRRLPHPHPVRVTYHAPVTVADLPPGADRRSQPALLADLVRRRIEAALAPRGAG